MVTASSTFRALIPLRETRRTGWLLLAGCTLAGFVSHARAQAVINLGSAASFEVLAATGISRSGSTTITGDVGTFPTTTLAGAGSFNFISGAYHGGDAFTQAAQTALATAYADAASRSGQVVVASELGATTLTPGVYGSAAGTFGITGTLTLNGGGASNAVFIFQMGTTLTTAANSQVLLTNGATAANVFWQVGSSATLGTNSLLAGNVLASTSITANSGAQIDGQLLAMNGAVTLDSNTLSAPSAIPEPATTAMIAAIGALGLAAWRRSRATS